MGYGELTRSKGALDPRGIAIICAYALLSGCSGTTYSGPGWSARVIDTETGAPIEGAIVVVRWPLERYSGSFAGWLFVTEAVTNSGGIFSLPAWGPLQAQPDSGRRTRMGPNVPEMAIFKSEYTVADVDCCSDSGYQDTGYGSGPSIRQAWPDGRVFGLEHYYGSAKKYIHDLERSLPTNGPECVFLQTPRIFAAAVNEDKRLRATFGAGLFENTLPRFEEQAKSDGCHSSVIAAIRGYLN